MYFIKPSLRRLCNSSPQLAFLGRPVLRPAREALSPPPSTLLWVDWVGAVRIATVLFAIATCNVAREP